MFVAAMCVIVGVWAALVVATVVTIHRADHPFEDD